jgi:signal transduction histidine kinase
VGHDLRTPLAAMRISAEFVDDEIVRDRLIGNLDELQLLTERLLSAARSEQGRGSNRSSPVETAVF